MDIKDILLGLAKDQSDFKDTRTIESVYNGLIKAIATDSRISGCQSVDDGIILIMNSLAKQQDFKTTLENLACFILLIFPVKSQEEKPQE